MFTMLEYLQVCARWVGQTQRSKTDWQKCANETQVVLMFPNLFAQTKKTETETSYTFLSVINAHIKTPDQNRSCRQSMPNVWNG